MFDNIGDDRDSDVVVLVKVDGCSSAIRVAFFAVVSMLMFAAVIVERSAIVCECPGESCVADGMSGSGGNSSSAEQQSSNTSIINSNTTTTTTTTTVH